MYLTIKKELKYSNLQNQYLLLKYYNDKERMVYMIRIFEKQLQQIISELNSKDIHIEINGSINFNFNLYKVIANYKRENGKIIFKDSVTNEVFTLETETIYNMSQNEDKNVLEFCFDDFVFVYLKIM